MIEVRKRITTMISEARQKWEGGTANIDARIADYLVNNGVVIQKWIPVTEQLPKFYPCKVRAVLVTMVDDCGNSFTTTAKYNEKQGYWYDFNDCRFMDFKVVAWMPKPDAYIEQEEEV